MKKWLIALLLIVGLSAASVYILVPRTFEVSKAIFIMTNADAAFRSLQNDSTWKRCWPGSVSRSIAGKSVFSSENFDFYVDKILLNSFDISILKHGDTVTSKLQIVSGLKTGITLEWSANIISGKYPLARLQGYFSAKKIHAIFEKVLENMKAFLSDTRNVYGLTIKNDTVKYQYLIAFKKTLDHYPDTREIYSMIDELRKYTEKAGAKESGDPMLNVTRQDSLQYYTQVALPLNIQLPGNDQFTSKWMYKGGEILSAEVKGGDKTIADAIKTCEQYIHDYRHSIVAIPFQSLVTNRLNEPDSSKWITIIYYPVILRI